MHDLSTESELIDTSGLIELNKRIKVTCFDEPHEYYGATYVTYTDNLQVDCYMVRFEYRVHLEFTNIEGRAIEGLKVVLTD